MEELSSGSGFSRGVSCEAAEAKAREGRVGLWRDAAPMPPWEWRKR